ncbi:hypothetical protein N9L91_02710, partial [Pseudomonadales bacterium]|nr:hypothetical protein [Pseudomonadales bacterium]
YVQGAHWYCNTGFKETNGKCVKVIAPENAYVQGAHWYCNTGFKETNGKCVKVIAPENAYVQGAHWYCNTGFKETNGKCRLMTAQEILEQESRQVAIEKELKRRELMGVSGDDCQMEYDSGANVCVEVEDISLNCRKNYDGFFRNCDVEISYEVRTDYKGNKYLDVDVECEAGINYKKNSGYSGSDSEYDDESHNLYSYGRDSSTMELSFSFSSYSEVYKANINSYECEIDSVYLW